MYDSALLACARAGDLEGLKMCLQGSKETERVRMLQKHVGVHGKTVLHDCAQNGHRDCVRFLLEDVGMAVDGLKRGDWTALMLASAKSHVGTVELLLQFGADHKLKNKDGWTAFHIACRCEGLSSILQYSILIRSLCGFCFKGRELGTNFPTFTKRSQNMEYDEQKRKNTVAYGMLVWTRGSSWFAAETLQLPKRSKRLMRIDSIDGCFEKRTCFHRQKVD